MTVNAETLRARAQSLRLLAAAAIKDGKNDIAQRLTALASELMEEAEAFEPVRLRPSDHRLLITQPNQESKPKINKG
jgi:hypothetical protein